MPALGYRRDPPKAPGEKPDFDARSRFRAAAIPPRASNRHLITSVLDQGGLGSCVAHAVLQAVRASHVLQGVDQPALGSRLMLYYLARAQLHETDVDGGTFIRLAFQTLNKFGFCPETLWPYADHGEAWKTKPALDAFRAAHDQRDRVAAPTAYYRIYDTGPARVAALKLALAAGHLVAFGCDVSDRFCAADFGDEPFDPTVGTIVGAHAEAAHSYDETGVEVVNSWGPDWHGTGHWRASWQSVQAWEDLWICEAAPYYSGAGA
jgi:hypothetical protein